MTEFHHKAVRPLEHGWVPVRDRDRGNRYDEASESSPDRDWKDRMIPIYARRMEKIIDRYGVDIPASNRLV
ncbi:MAG: hypothetical protein UY48_C0003G0018 [Candidatus Gottesmanbacteria bacterium GW2011_GWB1_49_7]|uniref:Uncharacterized protein n=1 Tax=Candidatus Gottesmanbacteria bacterium GW2011_GWB1_49_7 TaxID=1618448 RepID=A0A0G1W371_9BACT|nr:MAG: hypothetical protein UY48_C0003G0018 [Candidatus Gottesmanbacteria bacterium GW2011_GWB1_49_7]